MYIEMHYKKRVTELPEDTWLYVAIDNTSLDIINTSVAPSSYWEQSGYIEFTHPDRPGREIAKYSLALPAGFTNLTRAIVGEAQDWPVGTRISCCSPIHDEGLAAIMAAAEANMYQFWVAHRSQYAQFTAIADVTQSDLSDIVTLVRLLEEKADRRYARVSKVATPTYIRRR
jgi:hypothetical protein